MVKDVWDFWYFIFVAPALMEAEVATVGTSDDPASFGKIEVGEHTIAEEHIGISEHDYSVEFRSKFEAFKFADPYFLRESVLVELDGF